MTTPRGVTCHQCGGTTPLPEDLRVPTFPCASCGAIQRTADHAGAAAVSADALLGHMRAAVAAPGAGASGGSAPRFQGSDTSSRAAPCLRCGAELAVPLDLHVHELTCPGCRVTQRVNLYLPDAERFALDMARQVAGNQALKRAQAEGVPCTHCGGKNDVPTDGSIQLVCRFCGGTVLLSDAVDASAVARQRLYQGVMAMKDELVAQQAERDRRLKIAILSVVGVGIAVAIALSVLAGR